MKRQNIKSVSALILITGYICSIPAFALCNNVKISNDSNYDIECMAEHTIPESQGTGIFSDENLKYLSDEEQKELKEIQTLKDKGIKLSDEQINKLQCIVTTVVRGKLGDEKFKDFTSLMEKKNNNEDLSEEENHRLKDYKKTLHNCEDCSNNEVFKQFFR